MNISFTNRTTTQVELVPGTFYENVDGNIYCGIFDGYYIYVYQAYSNDWSYIKKQNIDPNEQIDAISSFGRVLVGDEFIASTQGRFEAHMAKVIVEMTGFRKEVQP